MIFLFLKSPDVYIWEKPSQQDLEDYLGITAYPSQQINSTGYNYKLLQQDWELNQTLPPLSCFPQSILLQNRHKAKTMGLNQIKSYLI